MTEGTGLNDFGFVFPYRGKLYAIPVVSAEELREIGGVLLPDNTGLGVTWESSPDPEIREIVNFHEEKIEPPDWFEMVRVIEVPSL